MAPQAPFAQGYLVDEYAGTVWQSRRPIWAAPPLLGTGRRSVTSGRWAAFLAAGHDGVLEAKTIDAMWFPQVMYDPDVWAARLGLA